MKNKLFIILGIGLIIAGPLSFITGVAYTLMLPNIYLSTSVAQMAFPDNHNEKYTEDALIAFTKQKAVLAENSKIFYPVIKELNLQEKWGHEGENLPINVAYKILQNSVHITADNSAVGLIQFSVKRDSPTESAKIANAICEVYARQNDDVTIAKVAEPNIRPVSPNLFMNIMFSLLQAVILSGIGGVCLFIGVRKEKSNRASETTLETSSDSVDI